LTAPPLILNTRRGSLARIADNLCHDYWNNPTLLALFMA
jgi:hypothetical protein